MPWQRKSFYPFSDFGAASARSEKMEFTGWALRGHSPLRSIMLGLFRPRSRTALSRPSSYVHDAAVAARIPAIRRAQYPAAVERTVRGTNRTCASAAKADAAFARMCGMKVVEKQRRHWNGHSKTVSRAAKIKVPLCLRFFAESCQMKLIVAVPPNRASHARQRQLILSVPRETRYLTVVRVSPGFGIMSSQHTANKS